MLAAVLVAGLVCFSSRAQAAPHVLVWSDGQPLTFLNPLVPRGGANDYLNMLTMAYLTKYDFGRLTPELAAVVPTQANGGISHDGLRVTFHLRPNLKWSDGEPLTSADVAFSIRVMKDPTTRTERFGFDLVTRVDTPNASTIVLHLSRRYSPIVRAIYSEDGPPILPKHLLAGKDVNTADYNALPVGAGPFRYRKWKRDDEVVLDANPFYYRGRPRLRTIIYRSIPDSNTMTVAIRTGTIDFWPLATRAEVDVVRGSPRLKVVASQGSVPDLVYVNTTSPGFDDVSVREALLSAIDRHSIVRRVFEGAAVVDDELVDRRDPAYLALRAQPYDPVKARSLLDAAGWRVGTDGIRTKGGTPLRVRLVAVSGITEIARLFELLRRDLHAVGMDVETRFSSPPIYLDPDPKRGVLSSGRFELAALGSQDVAAADLIYELSCTNGKPDLGNISRLCDRTYTQLAKRYEDVYDPVLSASLARAMQRRLHRLLPFIILAKRNDQAIMRDVVTGYRANAYSPFAGIFAMDVLR